MHNSKGSDPQCQQPASTDPELSIVIVSYNTGELLRRCINALVLHTVETSYEIIVVDNASSDDTRDIIRQNFPFIQLICNEVNNGFAAGQNTGLRSSRGRLLLVMNSDVIVSEGAVDKLARFLREADAEVAGAGPLVRNDDGTVAPSVRRSVHSLPIVIAGIIDEHFEIKKLLPSFLTGWSWVRALLSRVHDNFAAREAICEAEVLDGMCVLFKRPVLENVGLFDEQFFFDYEIVDLCNRIRQSGFKLLFYPGASVVHIGHQSRKRAPAIVLETHRSHLIFSAKHHPRRVVIVRGCIVAVSIVAALVCAVRMACGWVRGAEIRKIRESCRLYVQIAKMAGAFDQKTVRSPGLIRWA